MVNKVVTDNGDGDKTGDILSPSAYARLARHNVALEFFSYGVIDVEYRRIACKYSNYNLEPNLLYKSMRKSSLYIAS